MVKEVLGTIPNKANSSRWLHGAQLRRKGRGPGGENWGLSMVPVRHALLLWVGALMVVMFETTVFLRRRAKLS